MKTGFRRTNYKCPRCQSFMYWDFDWYMGTYWPVDLHGEICWDCYVKMFKDQFGRLPAFSDFTVCPMNDSNFHIQRIKKNAPEENQGAEPVHLTTAAAIKRGRTYGLSFLRAAADNASTNKSQHRQECHLSGCGDELVKRLP